MIDINFQKHILKNGLRYIEIPQKRTGALSLLVLVKAGSRFEKKRVWGISHFMEHMFFKGGERYKNAKEVSQAIDAAGGIFNAFTGKEDVCFYIKLPGKRTEIALGILSDMMLNCRFQESDIKKELKVIIEEINLYEDAPMFQVSEILESILYRGNSLSRRIIGEKETVRNISRKDFLQYKDNSYFSENIIVVAAGDTSFLSRGKVSDYFDFSRRKGQLNIVKSRIFQTKSRALIKFKDTEQSHISLGFHFPEATYNNGDFFPTRVLNTILGEGMSSRIFLSVREKRGLAYSISSYMQSFMDTGYIEIGAGINNSRIKEAISVILQECKKMKDEIVGRKELLKAKEYLKGKLILKLEDSLNVAFQVGKQELLQGEIIKIKDIFRKIDGVTVEDVSRLANKNFIKSNLNLAMIGPFKEKKSFEEILERGL